MPKPSQQIPQIKGALKFYRVMAWVTGTFLLLLLAEMILKYSPTHVELFLGGSGGFLSLQPVAVGAGCQWYSLFVPGGMGCDLTSLGDGVNLSLLILIVHGWGYVAYLFSNFNIWRLLRWPFPRFIWMALGGVVPFLSFIMEHHYHRVALSDIARYEAERDAAKAASASAGQGFASTEGA